MRTIRMVSRKPHEYAGVKLNPGDEFDCEEGHDVDLLTVMERAELAPQRGETYVTRDMSAEAPQSYTTKRNARRRPQ